jgi:hypothetical protein
MDILKIHSNITFVDIKFLGSTYDQVVKCFGNYTSAVALKPLV